MTIRLFDPAPVTVPPVAAAEPDEGALAPRRATAWDALGLFMLAGLMLAVERAVVVAMNTPLGRSHDLKLLTITCWALAPIALVALVVRDAPPLASVPGRLTAVWRDPPGPWVAFALGMILAIPILALYTPFIFYDSDSARIVAAIHYVQSGGGVRYFADTQEPYLSQFVLGPAIALRGLAGAKLAVLVSVQVLVGVISYITYRITHQLIAAAAAAAAFFAIAGIYQRATALPMYPVALALGYFGGWLAYRAMTEDPPTWWRFVVPAGVCLALAPEAQGTGQLFLAAPALVVVLAPTIRSGMATAARLYAVILVCSLPRIVLNLSVGGTSYATSPRADYWITKGYLNELQRNFWRYPGISESVPTFLSRLPGRFVGFLGTPAWVVLVLAFLGLVLAGRAKGRWFVLAAGGFLLLAVTVKRIPPFARYYAPFWPGLAILAGVAVARLIRQRNALARPALVLACGSLAVAVSVAFHAGVEHTETGRQNFEALPLRSYAAAVNDGKGVIGARAHQALLSVNADIPTWGDQFLTEQEYKTYLTWPSDQAVIDVMHRHNIGWVFFDRRRILEGPYNDTWLLPRYGMPARAAQQIEISPNFCRVLGGPRDFELFKLGPCPASAPGQTAAAPGG